MLEKILWHKPHVCPWWFAYTFDNPLRRLLHKPEKLLEPYVTPGMTVLDVGCGMGPFSLALAELVGENGRVICVDLQQEMLGRVEKRAERAGLKKRIHTHRCTPGDLGIPAPIDFGLAFWMIHEVPDTTAFFRQIREHLKPDGNLLIAEPKIHVPKQRFQEIVEQAEETGFRRVSEPSIRASWSALLTLTSRCISGPMGPKYTIPVFTPTEIFRFE